MAATIIHLHAHAHTGNLEPNLISLTKINAKWIRDLNVKYKTIKLLEDDIEENLDDHGDDNDLLNITPKT